MRQMSSSAASTAAYDGGSLSQAAAGVPDSSRLRAAWLAIVIALSGGIAIWLTGGSAPVRSLGQLGLFLVLLFPLSRVRIAGIQLPRAGLLLAAIAAVVGLGLRHAALDVADRSFVIAQLNDDVLQADAKILRDKMRSISVPVSSVHVGTVSQRVDTRAEAEAILAREPSVWGVVWGTPRWTNVALRQTAPIVIGGHDESSYGARTLRSRGIGDLQVVTSVPWIGVSNAKLPDTGIFLGRLAQIWPAFRGSLLQPDDSLEVEGFIRRWGIARAAWTSNTHRSLPMWMAGTFYLVQAVSGPELREGELRCALRSFASARAEFFNGGNVELEQAIMNNEAIATIFRGGIDVGVKQSKQQAIDLLMRATSKVGHAQGRGRPSATASSLFVNLQNLRGAHGSPAKRKKTL